MSNRIRWTPEEQQAISAEYARLLGEGMRKLAAIEAAQKRALPKNRRRTIRAITALPWLAQESQSVEPVMKKAPPRGRPLRDDDPPHDGTPAVNLREILARELGAFLRDVLREARTY